ncbi:hypothetical protein [Yanshouia hominis]|uniref:Uncharacterized protein n=1 Tax=Yanshouia hominis TaxID=2763673 RepID=A0ABR7NF32_9FIRM|nr:hypothetical protein [Yanshouia hominis]MBC8575003.1 hypothetical protein [Yanshouia hominis]
MTDKEMLQAMADLMDLKLKPIKEDISQLKEDLAQVKEDTAITRGAVNTILEWADDASIQVIPIFNRKSK